MLDQVGCTQTAFGTIAGADLFLNSEQEHGKMSGDQGTSVSLPEESSDTTGSCVRIQRRLRTKSVTFLLQAQQQAQLAAAQLPFCAKFGVCL